MQLNITLWPWILSSWPTDISPLTVHLPRRIFELSITFHFSVNGHFKLFLNLARTHDFTFQRQNGITSYKRHKEHFLGIYCVVRKCFHKIRRSYGHPVSYGAFLVRSLHDLVTLTFVWPFNLKNKNVTRDIGNLYIDFGPPGVFRSRVTGPR